MRTFSAQKMNLYFPKNPKTNNMEIKTEDYMIARAIHFDWSTNPESATSFPDYCMKKIIGSAPDPDLKADRKELLIKLNSDILKAKTREECLKIVKSYISEFN